MWRSKFPVTDAWYKKMDELEADHDISAGVNDYEIAVLGMKAAGFAAEAHGDQMYGEHSYVKHLTDVVAVLHRFGQSNWWILTAAWLHDVLEDTDVTYEQLKEEFGEVVADIVQAVTNEPGENRAERNAKTYPKIKANPHAIVLKLADRIANVESSLESSQFLLKMYRKEWNGFKKALYDPPQLSPTQEMWDHLEKIISDEDGESTSKI